MRRKKRSSRTPTKRERYWRNTRRNYKKLLKMLKNVFNEL